MRTAKRPLNKAAVKSADKAFYAKHPEMVKKGKLKPISPNSKKHKKLRKEWMESYANAGGGVTNLSPAAQAAAIRAANTSAKQSFVNAGVSSSSAPCPYAKPPQISPAATYSRPGKLQSSSHPDVVCEITQATVTCGHGRKPSPNGLLMVVPDSSVAIGDKVTCSASLKGGCGDHIGWTISGTWDSEEVGSKTSFLAKAYKPAIKGIFGMQEVMPQVYRVNAEACAGGPRTFEIHAYPPGEVSFTVNVTKMKDRIKDWLNHLPVEDEKLDKWTDEWLQGSVKYSGKWCEDKKSYRAYYAKAWTGGFDPLIGGKIKGQLYPPGLGGWLTQYVKAGIFVEFGLKSTFSISAVGKYWPDTREGKYDTGKIELGGNGSVKVSAEAGLLSKDVAEVVFAASTGVSVTGSGEFGASSVVSVVIQWDGLKGEATVKAAFGFFEFSRAYTIIQPGKLVDKPWQLEESVE